MTVVINPYRHEKVTKTRSEFLERVSWVKAIRKSKSHKLTFYICDLPELEMYYRLKDVITKGEFDSFEQNAYSRKIFGLEMSDRLADWFTKNDVDLILRQVVCYLADLYWQSDDELKAVMQEQLYPPIYQEVVSIAAKHFPAYSYQDRLDCLSYEILREAHEKIYNAACIEYYGSLPPAVLRCEGGLYPDYERVIDEWRYDSRTFSTPINTFYFNSLDWQNIVIDGSIDELYRAESSEELWNAWKHQFSTFERSKNHVYSLFSGEVSKGFVYVIEQSGDGLYKIGFTKESPEKRLASLQTGNPNRLELVGAFPCAGVFTEKNLHSLFGQYRKSGEWFRLHSNDVKNILSAQWRIENNVF